MKTSREEITDLLKALILISIAFAIIIRGSELTLGQAVLISALTVGVGFLLHEMGHKIAAQKYNCFAEFRANNSMLFIMIVFAYLAGIVFAAPGAVMISGHVSRRQNGIISMWGPLVNMILAIIFLPILLYALTTEIVLLIQLAYYGLLINAWLGLFNLIPFGNFDGIKILNWNKAAYFGLVIVGLALTFSQLYFGKVV